MGIIYNNNFNICYIKQQKSVFFFDLIYLKKNTVSLLYIDKNIGRLNRSITFILNKSIFLNQKIFKTLDWYGRELSEFSKIKVINSEDTRNLLLPYKKTFNLKKKKQILKTSYFTNKINMLYKSTINL